MHDVCRDYNGHCGRYDELARTANFTLAINAPDKHGNTVMHYIAIDKMNSTESSHEAIIFGHVLLRFGARINIKNPKTGKTALDCALLCRNYLFVYLFYDMNYTDVRVSARRILLAKDE